MNALNQIIIEGNVVRTPTVKETQKGTKVSVLPIAVNHFYRDNNGKDVDEVGFYDVETWGEKFTEHVSKYALQGRGVRVVGRLKQSRWKDENGKNHSKVFIVAEHVEFKPMKKEPQQFNSKTCEEIAEEENLAVAAQGLANEETVF
ncbi:single-stranded DNA-binding protein [Treponema pectinovorum]|uniref:single-stranded DNA-binding protein n=1 Tax=Treponema pectinovorum TaxID=164 RepID=UPI0011F0A629|nr:single-stranded DNA-binding protein [Treponema pectinovorum]